MNAPMEPSMTRIRWLMSSLRRSRVLFGAGLGMACALAPGRFSLPLHASVVNGCGRPVPSAVPRVRDSHYTKEPGEDGPDAGDAARQRVRLTGGKSAATIDF